MTIKTEKRLEREQQMYDALKVIAKDYQTPDRLRKTAERQYGLSYEEALEAAYWNILALAANTIHGMRRPK